MRRKGAKVSSCEIRGLRRGQQKRTMEVTTTILAATMDHKDQGISSWI